MWILYVKGESRGAGIMLQHLPSLPHHPVRTVSSPSEAVERLAQGGRSYDLVLMDYSLPGGDCTRLLRQLRGMGLTQEIIVLIEAGDDVKAAARAALAAGASDYVIQHGDYRERLRRNLSETPHQRRLRVALHGSPLLALYVGQNDEDIARINQCILRFSPYVYLEVARSWSEALERVAPSGVPGGYDVILLDSRLPKPGVAEALQDLYQTR